MPEESFAQAQLRLDPMSQIVEVNKASQLASGHVADGCTSLNALSAEYLLVPSALLPCSLSKIYMFTYFISMPYFDRTSTIRIHLVFPFSIEQMFSRNLTMRVSICLCYCVENTFPIPGPVPTYSHIILLSAHIVR